MVAMIWSGTEELFVGGVTERQVLCMAQRLCCSDWIPTVMSFCRPKDTIGRR